MSNLVQPPTETALQKEQRLYGELFDRLINAVLNRLFDLRPTSAAWRMRLLTILFLLTGFLLTLYRYPVTLWAQRLQEIFLYLLNPSYAAGYNGEPFTPFITLLKQALFDPHILQYLPIFLAPVSYTHLTLPTSDLV